MSFATLRRYFAVVVTLLFLGGCGASVDVEVQITGEGTVTSPDGIDCGDTCTTSRFVSAGRAFSNGGETMVLTAEPAPGFELLGWNYGDCSQSENPVCTIDLVYACGVGLNPLLVCIEGETYDAFLQPVFVESDMIADTGWSPESSCLLTIAGDVTCWGPAQVAELPDLSNPQQVETGRRFACAEDDTGVVCWGAYNVPQSPPVLFPPYDLAAGASFICALDADGVKCWDAGGESYVPELINPSNIRSRYPTVCVDDVGEEICWLN